MECDLIFDVRFLPNPYYSVDLKETTGLEPATAAYVLDNNTASEFFSHCMALLQFLLKQYQQSKRQSVTICIGCTGGQHRSVAVSEKIATALASEDIDVVVHHRDLPKA